MIDAFLSKPSWVSTSFSTLVERMVTTIQDAGFHVHTIGQTQAALKSPFDEVESLIQRCQCSIILGFPHIYVQEGRVKDGEKQKMVLPTEWNQIEASLSLAFRKPTLVLLHNTIELRGVFSPGAANLFVYQYNFVRQNWREDLNHRLKALRLAVEA